MTDQTPLAEILRPQSLDQYVGQEHLVGPTSVLRKAIESGQIPSMILWGPPGTGKTTLANIISKTLKRPFYSLSAINSGVKDVREVIDKAKDQNLFSGAGKPILFIDEIHRFSKSQQDSLLGAVETGQVTLIGATTENPSFEVISALLSRCQVYILKALEKKDLELLLEKGIEKLSTAGKPIELKETTSMLRYSGGDARKLLNNLQLIVQGIEGSPCIITNDKVEDILQHSLATYDKGGENHYDVISAFIKSMRGSDPNAAVYWLARMIAGGEDVKFIARRMLILASEDIGAANPTALVIANNCFQAVSVIGLPESDIILSQTAVYLANSPKSNATYKAIKTAKSLVAETGDLPVPLHLRNAPTKLMKEIGYGRDYDYSHDNAGTFSNQEFLPQDISGTVLYDPQKNARESNDRERLKNLWKDRYGY